jgi:hypothetical protein
MLFRDAAGFEGSVPFGWKGIGVEGYEGVFAAMLFERVVEG